MKYMGSKRQMLRNGLGDALDRAIVQDCRFVDLFTGSAAVARHVALKYDVAVVAVDLQAFSVALAEATLIRSKIFDPTDMLNEWIGRAESILAKMPWFDIATEIQAKVLVEDVQSVALAARCFVSYPNKGFVAAYAGWYFSPFQALMLDALRQALPTEHDHRVVALAGLVSSASRCAASPGHTAQPFKAETRAGVFLRAAWKRNVVDELRKVCHDLSATFAMRKGTATIQDAKVFARTLREGDLVFVDPPYSAVHYSRFYHVLESMARGDVGPVSGTGRYPSLSERPTSQFSIKTKSRAAITSLLAQISSAKARAIVTFPLDLASNGLSGSLIRDIAQESFHIEQEKVSSTFSTLGGDSTNRTARKTSTELILTLAPKRLTKAER